MTPPHQREKEIAKIMIPKMVEIKSRDGFMTIGYEQDYSELATYLASLESRLEDLESVLTQSQRIEISKRKSEEV